MDERIETAIATALGFDRAQCLAHGSAFSWEASVDQFLAGLVTQADAPMLPALPAGA
jgi:hypothetical protein